MGDNGWIKLHRKLQAKGYYKNSQYVHLWIHLLLLANHKEHEYMHDGGMILVKEGQLITGRKELSKATGIAETTIERILKLLENEHQIGQQKTNKYRVITILNWKEHQNRTEERTSNGHQTDTYKNDKKEKKLPAAQDFVLSEVKTDRYGNEIEPNSKKELNAVTKEYEELVSWLEGKTGVRIIRRPAQYKHLAVARAAGISRDRLKERALDLMTEAYYQQHGIDWASVVSSFDRKP